MLSNKDFILSNRFNRIFRDLTIAEVYSRIQNTTNIPELCVLLNARDENESKTAAHPGHMDSTFFKVG